MKDYHTTLVANGISDYSFEQLQEDMALGFLYNLWLSVAALMETDIEIIREVIAAQGSTLEKTCQTMSNRMKHSECLEFIKAY